MTERKKKGLMLGISGLLTVAAGGLLAWTSIEISTLDVVLGAVAAIASAVLGYTISKPVIK